MAPPIQHAPCRQLISIPLFFGFSYSKQIGFSRCVAATKTELQLMFAIGRVHMYFLHVTANPTYNEGRST